MKSRGQVFVVGLGPGVEELLTPMAKKALESASHWVGYKGYLMQAERLVDPQGKALHPFPMGGEVERCSKALQLASDGERVALISSGDPGIYGMAGPLLQMARDVDVEIIPGVPALSAAAARLGAPLMGDFTLISLSDLLVPWDGILYRLEKAASADLVVVLYNPGSSKRRDHLSKAMKILAHWRSADTPVGIVSRVFSPEEKVEFTTIGRLMEGEFTDMSATVVVGNSRTLLCGGRMVTDRGYDIDGEGGLDQASWLPCREIGEKGLSGVLIEERSLDFIRRGLEAYGFNDKQLEVVTRAIHAVADFSIAPLFRFSPGAVEKGLELLKKGASIWLDTRMAAAGVSKSLAGSLGCSIGIPNSDAKPPAGLTRSAYAFREIGERLHGSLVVVGNAPTVLEELCRLSAQGVHPGLVVGVPVGFVGTVRSKKWLMESGLSHITLLGNRGGTPIAVAIVNALLRLACR